MFRAEIYQAVLNQATTNPPRGTKLVTKIASVNTCTTNPKELVKLHKSNVFQVKGGVNIEKLCDQIIEILPTLSQAFKKVADAPLIITSGNDGRHTSNSKHYSNMALDLRVKHLSRSEAKRVYQELRKNLDSSYRLIYNQPGHYDHIHVDYSGGRLAMGM